jgi:hypothetical protein
VIPHKRAARLSWSPNSANLLAFTEDGSCWLARAPDFAVETHLTDGNRPIDNIIWSPDGNRALFAGERPADDNPRNTWETIFVLEMQPSPHEKDLLPVGSPFRSPGRRTLVAIEWLDNQRVFFSLHTGTGYEDHYIVDESDLHYGLLCMGRGPLQWLFDHSIAVAENHGADEEGLGLIEASSYLPLEPNQPLYRECKSSFQGSSRVLDSGESPNFDGWFPNERRVLYTNSKAPALRIWDTLTGARSTLIENAYGGTLSPDGAEIALNLYGEPKTDSDGDLLGGSGPRGPEADAVCVIDSRTKRLLSTLRIRHRPNRLILGWSPDSRFVVCRDPEGSVSIFSDSSEKPKVLTIPARYYGWAPKGKWLWITLPEKPNPQMRPVRPSVVGSPAMAGAAIPKGAGGNPVATPITAGRIEKTNNLFVLEIP